MTDKTPDNLPPLQDPTDMQGVAIHLSYLRRDLYKLTQTMENITSNYVPISIFLDLKSIVMHLETENEKRKEYQDTLTGKMWGVGIIASVVVGLLSIVINHIWK